MLNRLLPVLTVTGMLAAAYVTTEAIAQDAPPEHMRGTIAAVNGNHLTIDTREGTSETVTLNADAPVFGVVDSSRDQISQGQFVGITSIKVGPSLVAVEVHIFDDALRGLAEGHYPWTLLDQPNMMTNADVAWIVETGSDTEVKVRYKEGEGNKTGSQTIIIPDDIPVVFFDATDKANLQVGKPVFLLAVDTGAGDWVSPAIVVGLEGTKPPF